jgi:glycosyltransferase involved in cell wall biosynthesis
VAPGLTARDVSEWLHDVTIWLHIQLDFDYALKYPLNSETIRIKLSAWFFRVRPTVVRDPRLSTTQLFGIRALNGTLMSPQTVQTEDALCSAHGRAAETLSVFQVMPREMHFGPTRATSIDLCVRDLVSASRFAPTTRIFAERIDNPFPGFDIDPFPPARRALTYSRAGYVARVARLARPDIIVVQQHLPTAAAIVRRLPGRKVILHRHNFAKAVETGVSLRDTIRRAFRKRRYAQLAGIVHVSEACASAFAQAWPDVPVPSCIVHNGLDFADWHPEEERRKEILLVGRCAPEKGVLEAAQAIVTVLASVPDWHACFMLSNIDTHPGYFDRLREVLADLGPRVTLRTQLPFAEIKTAYESAAIALVPSKWQEPFGRTALEAHAGGAALISSGTGGLSEISGSTALMLSSVTPEAIAAAIETLIVHPELRHRLAREGAERVRGLFDIKTQASRLDRFCQAVANGWQATSSGCAPSECAEGGTEKGGTAQ